MPINTSASGGYLQPYGTQPAEDDALDDQLHDLVVGITGLAPTLVRPRWQPGTPAKEPDLSTNWCSVGVQNRTPEINASILHHPDPVTSTDPNLDGFDEMRRHEQLEVLCSFYGEGAPGLASKLRDGLSIPQNREQLLLNGMALICVDAAVTAPDFINMQWRRRVDLMVHINRVNVRRYPVENLLQAIGTIERDNGDITPFDSNNART